MSILVHFQEPFNVSTTQFHPFERIDTPFDMGVGLVYGGAAFSNHYIIRLLLWQKGVMPWHYVRFLEEATERILLQRVGGGYRFIHPLFQEYFASLGTAPPAKAVTPPPSPLSRTQHSL